MPNGFAFALLVGTEKCLPSIRFHLNFTGCLDDKPIRIYLPEIDQRQDQSIGKRSSKLLGQIQSKTCPSGSFNVEVSNVGIETHALQG